MMAERATATSIPWQERNQAALVAEFAALRHKLDGEAVPVRAGETTDDSRTAINTLTNIFELSTFERELLLLLAGVEMDSALAERVTQLTGGKRVGVTFSLAMATLASPHWSALSPSSPLRRWKLITLETVDGLSTASLHIDERVLHYLAGTNRIEARLVDVLFRKTPPEWMDDDHFRLGNEILRRLQTGEIEGAIVHLCGDDESGQEDVASLIAHRSGRQLYVLRHEDTPPAGAELEQFLHLWMREQMLLPAMLLLQWGNEPPSTAARQLAERLPGTLMIASREPLGLHRAVECHQVDKPAPAAQLRLWQDALGTASEEADSVLGEIAQSSG